MVDWGLCLGTNHGLNHTFVVFEKRLNQILEKVKYEDGLRSAALWNFLLPHKSFYGTFHCCCLVKSENLAFGVDLETFPRIWGTELPGFSVEVRVEDFTANNSAERGIAI